MKLTRRLGQVAPTPEQIRERISRTQTAANELVAAINNASATGRLPTDQVRVLQNAYVQPAMDAIAAATDAIRRNQLEAAARWLDEADGSLANGIRELSGSRSGTGTWFWIGIVAIAGILGLAMAYSGRGNRAE